MNNTIQYVNNIPYDYWHLALGVGLGLAALGILSVGVIGYWWFHATGPLPDTVIIGMNNIEQLCCFPSVFSSLLTANLGAQVFCPPSNIFKNINKIQRLAKQAGFAYL